MRRRVIAGAIIKNDKDEVLLLKMANWGVFPNKWGLVGGGLEEGEKVEEALRREVKEESGLEVHEVEPYWFFDDEREKLYADGSKERLYMIYLIFVCRASSSKVSLNEEWEESRWVRIEDMAEYDLNEPTQTTFKRLGWL